MLALVPRDPGYLSGIISSVYIHNDLEHLFSNSLSLAVCHFGLFYFYREIASKITILAHFLVGVLVWCFARQAYHIGASGLIYAFDLFILVSGIIRSNRNLMVFALIVLSLHSGLIWGMVPGDPEISWEGHLAGGITGTFLAIIYRKEGPPDDVKKVWEDEQEEEQENEDEYKKLL